ncbi:UNVERIFIED_CONTAM: hypothetical protein Slati_0763500 [Sesamum latifolium]|uniref:DDE Tnp4 domain-containing protein n=1 Tax=Sesamum latifolium TaxID=2727402 RepID=A0AAW2XJH5_9LAMI
MRHHRRILALLAVQQVLVEITVALTIIVQVINHIKGRTLSERRVSRRQYHLNSRLPAQIRNLHRLVLVSDETCLRNLRMDRNAFGRLCCLLEQSGGIKATKNISVAEQVAMFLSIIAHHKKNCVVKHDFIRYGRTVSKHFHSVLLAVCKLHTVLLAKPCPITNVKTLGGRFKVCLDYPENIRVFRCVRWYLCRSAHSDHEKGRYRTRKGQVAVNVLGVCNPNMQFIYVLSGWEGSAADSRVLRDAIHQHGGLRVPVGNYYLCDNGYANAEGFLTPYRGVRYHLREWDRGAGGPQNKQELFNLKHSSARNVIERTFGLLKVRWGILRSQSFYPIDIQSKIIIACCLLHNFIRNEMPDDPLELEIPDDNELGGDTNADYTGTIESNSASSAWRDALATSMYNDWLGRR